MKKISKLRLYYAASSGFVLAIIPTFLLLTILAKMTAVKNQSTIVNLAVYGTCFLILTILIYRSNAEFSINYCRDCQHEWPQKRNVGSFCPRCGAENREYNDKP